MKSLSDICELVVDCEHKTAPTQENGYPSIRTPNIGRGYFILNGVNRVSEETYKLWTRRATPKGGDLILAREAPVGNVAVIPKGEQYCLGQRTVLIRPKKDIIDPNYLCFLLLSPGIQGELLRKSSGATVHHLNIKDIRALQLPNIPSLNKQKQISSNIKKYDNLIATNQRRIALLEEAARLIYREWFVRLRFPGRESIALKNGIPENWKKANLFEICAVNYGYPFKSTHFNSTKTGAPAVRIRDIPDISTSTYTTEVVDDTYKIDRGDFLIGMDGIFHMNHWIGPKAYLVQRVCKVRPEDEKLLAYIGLALRDPIKTFETTIQGATVAHLGAKHLKQIEINVPVGLDEELGILNDLLWQQIHLREMNMQLAQARDLLLPKLMSGQIDVSNIQLPDEDVVT